MRLLFLLSLLSLPPCHAIEGFPGGLKFYESQISGVLVAITSDGTILATQRSSEGVTGNILLHASGNIDALDLPGTPLSRNDHGQILVRAGEGFAIWHPDGSLSQLTMPEGASAFAVRLNNQGKVAGSASYTPAIWDTSDGIRPIALALTAGASLTSGPSAAVAVNATDAIAGSYSTPFGHVAFWGGPAIYRRVTCPIIRQIYPFALSDSGLLGVTCSDINRRGSALVTRHGMVYFTPDSRALGAMSQDGSWFAGTTPNGRIQWAMPCETRVSVAPTEVPVEGGTVTINVEAGEDCTWSRHDTVIPVNMTGPARLTITIPPSSAPVLHRLVMAGHPIPFPQGAACGYLLEDGIGLALQVPAEGGTFQLRYQATEGCKQTPGVTPNFDQERFVGVHVAVAGETGAGVVEVSVGANPGRRPRTESLRIGDAGMQIVQNAIR